MRTEPSFSTESNDPVEIRQFPSDGDTESQLLSDYRQRYGLSGNPFADDPHFPFYTGAQRSQVLEQLLHLCQFSHNLLVVAGDYGVGKTRMAQALIDSLNDADDICFLEGQVNSTYDALIGDLLSQLELPDADALDEFLQKNTDQDSLAVVIIDNAHHLADQVVLELLAMLQANPDSRLHVVLFTEPLLLDRLAQFNLPELTISDFILDKFTLSESVDYLNFRMEMADYLGPEIFSEAKVEPWWRQSQGQLLELHQYAQEKLLAAVSPAKKSYTSSNKGLPIPHIVAASVLGAGLLMTFIYWNGSSPKQPKISSTPVALRELPVSSITSAAATQSSQAMQVSVSAATQSSVAAIQEASKSAQMSSIVLATAAASSVASQTKAEAPVVRQSVVPLVQTNASKADTPTPAKVSKSSAPLPKDVKKSEPAAEVVKTSSKTEDVRSVKSVSGASSFTDQEKTLLSWSETEYTLQLVGLSSEKAVHEFLAEQPNKKDLLVFKSLRQGKDWYVVVAGRYPTSAKARQAAQLLPEVQKKAAPWPRDLKTIQKEIKQR